MFMARLLCFLFSLLTSTLRSRLSLQLEIAALHHQLSAYRLKGQRPRIAPPDRLLWSVLAKLWPQWRRALFFVQPRTVTLWQQASCNDECRTPPAFLRGVSGIPNFVIRWVCCINPMLLSSAALAPPTVHRSSPLPLPEDLEPRTVNEKVDGVAGTSIPEVER